jgi:hypothetical protein
LFAVDHPTKALEWAMIRARQRQDEPRLLIIKVQSLEIDRLSNGDYVIKNGIPPKDYKVHKVRFTSDLRFTNANYSEIERIVSNWR